MNVHISNLGQYFMGNIFAEIIKFLNYVFTKTKQLYKWVFTCKFMPLHTCILNVYKCRQRTGHYSHLSQCCKTSFTGFVIPVLRKIDLDQHCKINTQ